MNKFSLNPDIFDVCGFWYEIGVVNDYSIEFSFDFSFTLYDFICSSGENEIDFKFNKWRWQEAYWILLLCKYHSIFIQMYVSQNRVFQLKHELWIIVNNLDFL